MVPELMRETMFFSMTSLASSEEDQRDNGFPESLGSVHARAVIWALWVEGKKARPAGSRSVLNDGILLPTFAPLPDGPRAASHFPGDIGFRPFGMLPGQKKNLGAQNVVIGRFAQARDLSQMLHLRAGQSYGGFRLRSSGHGPSITKTFS